ncbi:HAD-IIA family hydrolase [Curvivirga sp.]|uniref:HAD-IIA family hydrolase n=1 Tax=Curvivirga sp. TaxID=2856848 RepID=UPI003B5A91BB
MTKKLDEYDAILSDLDGCLISGSTPLPGCLEFIEKYENKLYIVSNNSTDTPLSLSAHLKSLGINFPSERILLAGTTSVDYIAKHYPGKKLDLHGLESVKNYAQESGLKLSEDNPDVVLLTRNLNFTYTDLVRLSRHAFNKTPIIIANIDGSHPAPDGARIPETGALLAALKSCVPDLVFTSIGKPEINLFEDALMLAKTSPSQALFIGDNPETDGKGAKTAGLDFKLIQHGNPMMDLNALMNHQHRHTH